MTMAKDLKSRVNDSIALTRQEQEAQLPRIEQSLAAMVPELQLAVPSGLDVVQFTRDAIMLARKTPKLALCEPSSVMGAFMTAAQLGLRPGVGALGQCHILPFWNRKVKTPIPGKPGRFSDGGFEATFVIGYPGMIELANRSGRVLDIAARAVYMNEEFSVDYGAAQPLVHRPVLDGDKGELRGFYSDVRTVNGGQHVEYWSKADMEKHRDRFALAKTKTGDVFGPWKDHFIQMGRKTMVRQAFNYMPRSAELSTAIAVDNTVRRDWKVIEGSALEDIADVSEEIDPENAGPMPEDNFRPDTSPGAPPVEDQRAIWEQDNAR